VPGSNGRPPACKARAAAAVYRRLSLRPLGERWIAHICCALLRSAASKPLPHELFRWEPAGPTVLSGDYVKVPDDEIKDLRANRTIVDGWIVHAEEPFSHLGG
jgi:hypothetical protein